MYSERNRHPRQWRSAPLRRAGDAARPGRARRTRPSASSSLNSARITSPAGGVSSSAARRKETSICAIPPFISSAPRPQTHPSMISPQKGGCVQDWCRVVTTSRCPYMSRGGATPRPFNRATRLGRRSSRARMVVAMPASCSRLSSQPMHSASLPGGFVVSKRIRRCRMATGSCGLVLDMNPPCL